MGFRRPTGARQGNVAYRPGGGEPQAAAPALRPGAIERYVERFNAAEVAAGCLPSDTLGRFLAVLELRDVLRRSRRLRAGNPFLRTRTGQETPAISARPAKMRRSVVQRLFQQGHLLRPHLSAADDIEDLLLALSRGMFAAARRTERVQESPAVSDLFDRLEPRQQRLMREVYWPWLDWLAGEPLIVRLPDGGSVRYGDVLPLVIDIVVDNCSLRRAEQDHGLRNGAAPTVLRAALHRFCLLAGYLHLPDGCEDFQLSEKRRWRRRRAR